MTEREPWLGHHDFCSLQWSDRCDCINGPEYLAGCKCAYPEDKDPAAHIGCPIHEAKTDG